MISDGINIVDGYIINFSIEFDISILKGITEEKYLLTVILTKRLF